MKIFYLIYLSFPNNSKEINRYCVIIFDEVYLQPHLSLSLKYKNVEGLEDHDTTDKSKHIADHALVFLLRGINAKCKQPFDFQFC